MSNTGSYSSSASTLPPAIQKNAPGGVEAPTSSKDPVKDNGYVWHATGPSVVPEAIQRMAPKGLEEALPESIHPTQKH